MSASSVTIQIPGQAIAAAVRQRREARQLERTALRERRIAHHTRSLSGRTIGARSLNIGSAVAKLAELKARRDLLADGAPKAVLEEVESELMALEDGGSADQAERAIAAAEERLEQSWEQEVSQEVAVEAFASHPWCRIEAGSVERSGGRLRVRLDVDDGRSMAGRTDVARGEVGYDVRLSVQTAGAGIHEIETPQGILRGCDAELGYVAKLAADSGLGATVRHDPAPGFGVAVDLKSQSVGQ